MTQNSICELFLMFVMGQEFHSVGLETLIAFLALVASGIAIWYSYRSASQQSIIAYSLSLIEIESKMTDLRLRISEIKKQIDLLEVNMEIAGPQYLMLISDMTECRKRLMSLMNNFWYLYSRASKYGIRYQIGEGSQIVVLRSLIKEWNEYSEMRTAYPYI